MPHDRVASPLPSSADDGRASTSPVVVVPDEVDDDLRDKSDYVKATVMARRNAARQRQQERVAAVEASDQARSQEQAALDDSRRRLAPKLDAWALDKHGQPRNIQALLSSLDSVLWEGAQFRVANKSALIDPKKLKITYFKACRIVHPDRIGPDADADRKYIAQTIFDRLNKAYKQFEDSHS